MREARRIEYRRGREPMRSLRVGHQGQRASGSEGLGLLDRQGEKDMKTDDLIDLLSTNVEPVPRRRVGWMLGGAIAASAVAAVAAVVFAYGVRPDFGRSHAWAPL